MPPRTRARAIDGVDSPSSARFAPRIARRRSLSPPPSLLKAERMSTSEGGGSDEEALAVDGFGVGQGGGAATGLQGMSVLGLVSKGMALGRFMNMMEDDLMENGKVA